MTKNHPKIGIGVLIFNDQNILLGQRKNSHGALTWAAPGGHLEFGESIEECGMREVKEETGLTISTPQLVAVSNDVFEKENKHYVTLFLSARYPQEQLVQNTEPDKTVSWEWFKWDTLPDNLFLPLQNLLQERGADFFRSLLNNKVNAFNCL